MTVKDHRTIWIEKNDLELMVLIQKYIESEGITSVRDYQNAKKEFPNKVPSLWFINDRFGSWGSLQNRLGNRTYDRYRWAKYSDDPLFRFSNLLL